MVCSLSPSEYNAERQSSKQDGRRHGKVYERAAEDAPEASHANKRSRSAFEDSLPQALRQSETGCRVQDALLSPYEFLKKCQSGYRVLSALLSPYESAVVSPSYLASIH